MNYIETFLGISFCFRIRNYLILNYYNEFKRSLDYRKFQKIFYHLFFLDTPSGCPGCDLKLLYYSPHIIIYIVLPNTEKPSISKHKEQSKPFKILSQIQVLAVPNRYSWDGLTYWKCHHQSHTRRQCSFREICGPLLITGSIRSHLLLGFWFGAKTRACILGRAGRAEAESWRSTAAVGSS